MNVGLISSLLEVGQKTRRWRVVLVASMAPQFWEGRDFAVESPGHPRGAAVEAMRRLAEAATPGAMPECGVVLGPGIVADVVTGRQPGLVDIGSRARFPALGLAVNPACDPAVVERVRRAHHEALALLHRRDDLLHEVLVLLGIAAPDLRPVTRLLRERFRLIPVAEAPERALAGARVLGLDMVTVRAAFGP